MLNGLCRERVISLPAHMCARKCFLYLIGILVMIFLIAACTNGPKQADTDEKQTGEEMQSEGELAIEEAQDKREPKSIDPKRVRGLDKNKPKGEFTPEEQSYLERAKEKRKLIARNKGGMQSKYSKSRKQYNDEWAQRGSAGKASEENAILRRKPRDYVNPAEIGPDAPYNNKIIRKLRLKEKSGTISALELAYLTRMRLPMVASSYKSEVYGGKVVPFFIYLPPSYETDPERRFPVVYFLHGGTGGPSVGIWLSRVIDGAIKAGESPEMIIVSPQGRILGMWADSAKNPGRRSASSVVKDLIPHIDATYRTIAKREGRAIEGKSMGGFGAAHMGFKYPEIFGAVSMFSSAMHRPEFLKSERTHIFNSTFDGDIEYALAESPWTLPKTNLDRIKGRTQVRLYVGTKDGKVFKKNQDYHKMLEELGIEHEYQVVQRAGHTWTKLFSEAKDHFAFYRRAFGGLNDTQGKDDKDRARTFSSSPIKQ